MASPKTQRKLTAILSADVHGYSRLMSAEEEATITADIPKMMAAVHSCPEDTTRKRGRNP